jgi:2'-5' RNA ligase
MRLFVALELPAEVKSRLSGLSGGIPGLRWVPPENYHLTLRFIGEVDRVEAEGVDEALAGIRAPAFDLTLAGVGTFERAGKVQALWVGAERTAGLAHLAAKVETALQRVGFPPERRRFAPHVTLARGENGAGPALDKLVGFVQRHNLFREGPVRVERFTLFSSHLGREQASYTPEVEYDLAA